MVLHRPVAVLASLSLALACAAAAQAADLPQRKSGLWELDSRMEGMPMHGPVQVCVDQNTDNLLQERARAPAQCSVMEVNRGGGGQTTIHSVCKVDAGTTVTTDAVITGDFNSGYRSEMQLRYSPPRQGRSEMKVVTQARWLGPCQPGQQPGDVLMPGMPGGRMNLQQMLNDPQLRELMKRQGRGG